MFTNAEVTAGAQCPGILLERKEEIWGDLFLWVSLPPTPSVVSRASYSKPVSRNFSFMSPQSNATEMKNETAGDRLKNQTQPDSLRSLPLVHLVFFCANVISSFFFFSFSLESLFEAWGLLPLVRAAATPRTYPGTTGQKQLLVHVSS